ncbi:Hypp3646 [Branchiostoma lanceolatum]|uniref:Hypp3646 protein n=1 Tax=Branchiostoma lanceolatum TaxID=7740 RepID=A0A8K0A0N5_BRALA|nr:Hypp3646 [Branchiostoma lanceolatum]
MKIEYERKVAACIVQDRFSIVGAMVVFLVGGAITWIFLIKTWRTMANDVHGQPIVAPPQSLGLAFRTLFTLTALHYLLWVPGAILAFDFELELLKVSKLARFWIFWLMQFSTLFDFVTYSLTQQSFRNALKNLCRDVISVLWRCLTGRDFFPTPVLEFQNRETFSENATVHRSEETPSREQPVHRSEATMTRVLYSELTPSNQQPARLELQPLPNPRPKSTSDRATAAAVPATAAAVPTAAVRRIKDARSQRKDNPSDFEWHLSALIGSDDIPDNDQPAIQLEDIEPTIPAVLSRVSASRNNSDDDETEEGWEEDVTQLPGMLLL